jgi:Xaa-Pro aminopeptidase
LDSSPLNPKFLKDKLALVRKTMREKGIDAWIVFSREGNDDPLVFDLGLASLIFRAAAIIQADGGSEILLNPFDIETVKERGFYDNVSEYPEETIGPKIYETVDRLKPKKIAVNMSEDFSFADGLSSGMRDYLSKSLKGYGKELVSSEDLVISLRAKLIPEELELMKKSIAKCEEIYGYAEDLIKVGVKDKEIYDLVKKKVYDQGMEVAWDQAPSIMIGRNPASHLSYNNDTLRDGDFLRIDFGVKYEGYCSDIERVYYVGRGSPPAELKRMFDTAIRANDSCISLMREGVRGYIPDKGARDVVKSAGYPDFMAGTGHALGRFVHEVGPQLEPLWPDTFNLGNRPLESNMIFTVEPSVQGKYGLCNLEQDVLVTDGGPVQLSKRQQDLIMR